eukprot:PITA_14082
MSLGPKVWHSVLNGYTAPSTLPTNQDERKAYIANAKALYSITSGVTDSEFTKVMNCDSAKEVWDKRVSLYDGDSKVKKEKLQTHRRQFESLKMDDEEGIASYFLQVAEVVNSLKGLGENIEIRTIVQKVLRSLPNRFDSKVSAIEEIKDLDTLTMDELHGILIAYEMRTGIPSSKDATFKTSKSKKGKEWNTNSDDSDVESELAQFIDEDLPEKEIEDYEVDPLIEENEEEPEKEEKNQEKHKEKEPSQTPSKVKFLQKHHPEEQIIGNIDEWMQTQRRMTRTPKKNDVSLISMIEPETFTQPSKDPHWVKSMEEEMSQIEKNETWELVPRPKDKNIIGTKWVFKNKMNEDGQIIRNNARLVCKGYSQIEGIDFEETFAPVARMEL